MTEQELIAYLRLQGLDKDIAAADRIEELVKERDRWKDAYRSVSRDLNLVVPDNDRLKSERDAAEAKLTKAVEALRPFAEAADTWEPDDGDSNLGARIEHPHHGLERHAEFTFGDLRRARTVLDELRGK